MNDLNRSSGQQKRSHISFVLKQQRQWLGSMTNRSVWCAVFRLGKIKREGLKLLWTHLQHTKRLFSAWSVCLCPCFRLLWCGYNSNWQRWHCITVTAVDNLTGRRREWTHKQITKQWLEGGKEGWVAHIWFSISRRILNNEVERSFETTAAIYETTLRSRLVS